MAPSGFSGYLVGNPEPIPGVALSYSPQFRWKWRIRTAAISAGAMNKGQSHSTQIIDYSPRLKPGASMYAL